MSNGSVASSEVRGTSMVLMRSPRKCERKLLSSFELFFEMRIFWTIRLPNLVPPPVLSGTFQSSPEPPTAADGGLRFDRADLPVAEFLEEGDFDPSTLVFLTVTSCPSIATLSDLGSVLTNIAVLPLYFPALMVSCVPWPNFVTDWLSLIDLLILS